MVKRTRAGCQRGIIEGGKGKGIWTDLNGGGGGGETGGGTDGGDTEDEGENGLHLVVIRGYCNRDSIRKLRLERFSTFGIRESTNAIQ